MANLMSKSSETRYRVLPSLCARSGHVQIHFYSGDPRVVQRVTSDGKSTAPLPGSDRGKREQRVAVRNVASSPLY